MKGKTFPMTGMEASYRVMFIRRLLDSYYSISWTWLQPASVESAMSFWISERHISFRSAESNVEIVNLLERLAFLIPHSKSISSCWREKADRNRRRER